MSYSALPQHTEVSLLRTWYLAAAGAVLAMLLHVWGLYRVTGPSQPPWFPHVDKLQHAVGFALPVMLILLAAALRRPPGWQWPSSAMKAVVVAIFAAHAVVSEVIQHVWYLYRTGDPLDVVADWVGIAVGLVLLRVVLLTRGADRGIAAP
jgi:VanZ family protein